MDQPDPAAPQDAQGDAALAAAPSSPARKRRRVALVVAGILAVVCFGFLAGGFLRFASAVTQYTEAASPSADAIVVLTGGSERVKKALSLLDEGRAGRLLISGVHPETTPKQIVRRTESDLALFACCIDLDRNANNTLENAAETAKWVRSNGFSSVIVVTSAYHMPRALLELRSVMPETTLVAVAVQGTDLELNSWFRHAGVSLLLLREYMKYMFAWVRISAMGSPAP
ncbi:YdcF family protein [Stappia stellulata]|uniref:YdcF family protein n=1 Tax=Stappia stellulata TaxID=71235 RepID=UPI001CD3C9E9|nr:YdcF family protein [Stappia stellulata]MCA1243132.1 YdcF family protein [Stappia stellulata]